MKRAGVIAVLFALVILGIPSASAITPVPPLKASVCYPIIKGAKIESYASWVFRLETLANGSSCYTFRSTRFKSYKDYLGIAKTQIKVTELNEYDKRMQACKVSNTSFLVGDLKCIFRVSFFPSKSVMADSIGDLTKSVKTRQPLSYIPVAYQTISTAFDSMGGRYCASSGGNSLDFSVPIQKGLQNMEFVLPCKPPQALQVFRGILVSLLYLGLALWLYSVGLRWWDSRQS